MFDNENVTTVSKLFDWVEAVPLFADSSTTVTTILITLSLQERYPELTKRLLDALKSDASLAPVSAAIEIVVRDLAEELSSTDTLTL